MSDRELLEFAAKAAGIVLVGPVEKFIVQFDERHKGGFIVVNERGGHSAWNPRRDDGDTFRLAFALKLTVTMNEHGASVSGPCGGFVESDPANPLGAARLAVLRAAAAIGEKTP